MGAVCNLPTGDLRSASAIPTIVKVAIANRHIYYRISTKKQDATLLFGPPSIA
jgi:hypothetical protein